MSFTGNFQKVKSGHLFAGAPGMRGGGCGVCSRPGKQVITIFRNPFADAPVQMAVVPAVPQLTEMGFFGHNNKPGSAPGT